MVNGSVPAVISPSLGWCLPWAHPCRSTCTSQADGVHYMCSGSSPSRNHLHCMCPIERDVLFAERPSQIARSADSSRSGEADNGSAEKTVSFLATAPRRDLLDASSPCGSVSAGSFGGKSGYQARKYCTCRADREVALLNSLESGTSGARREDRGTAIRVSRLFQCREYCH